MHHQTQTQLQTAPCTFMPSLPQRQTIHDLRNLFGIVVAAKNILARDPGQTQRITLLEAIEDAAMQGGRLTSDLLGNGVRSENLQTVDVGARLADLPPMMSALAGPRVEFDLEIGMPESRARLDPAAFDASILELIANAGAADARTIVVRSARVGARLWILICDDGRGMASQALARARRGVDTGCAHGAGLSRVHDFVRASHGHLRIRSQVDGGTAIALILPTVLSVTLADRCTPSRSAFPKPKRKETIHEKVRQSAAA
ncbi:HAMP domain-containing sensor histidine kinase [uncultured Sphingomonas sp.]|uniref:sensor histidine kinase n=1 Tax=uncultured Sphingomonas sp. TaxID=158754 RepID=UPI0025E3C92E|nr:HAMP domain-containing sensor histidine kinase [uncultured Sphingomonas sp.]